uniref:Uncharacterized protein n=1 Tax=Arundo donax TaxID=35708 RepID=A0A0A9B6F7_ARUDO
MCIPNQTLSGPKCVTQEERKGSALMVARCQWHPELLSVPARLTRKCQSWMMPHAAFAQMPHAPLETAGRRCR